MAAIRAVDRVAVIGAGASGLGVAKYLLAENKFSKVELFEQRSRAGGVWNYSRQAQESQFHVPRTTPTNEPDEAIWSPGSDAAEFVSALYDSLETNIPQTLMRYSDLGFAPNSSLFPTHHVVKDYLLEYAKPINNLVRYQSQILDVSKVKSDAGAESWQVTALDLKTKEKSTQVYDAVVVANGHYNDPFVPAVKGIAEFNKAHPRVITHSKYYRRPEEFKDQKVLVVGYGASGLDICSQLKASSKLPVLVSERSTSTVPAEESDWLQSVPEIVEFLPENRAVRLSDGKVESDVDSVIFCTGYLYAYPFLGELAQRIAPTGSRAYNLYQHIFYNSDPTLAFVGIPQRVVPFVIAEAQGAFIARVWAGRLGLPSLADMQEWEKKTLEENGDSTDFHTLAFPKDADYVNLLHDLSLTARKVDGLANDGVGKQPVFWTDEFKWYRQRVPLIKNASRKWGEKRKEITHLSQLGFDYEEWLKEQKPATALL